MGEIVLLKLCAYMVTLHLAHYFIFLSPMAKEAEEMHMKQIDPTDIVLIPYVLSRLFVYVALIIAFLIATQCFRGMWYHLLTSSAMVLACTIVAGASPTTNILHTAISALYCAALCLADPPIWISVSPPPTFAEHIRYRLRGHEVYSDLKQRQQAIVARAASQGTLAGAVVFQILRLYDRGWQVQRWPVPVITGSTIGWTVGAVVGIVWIRWPSRLEPKLSEKD
ncbi:hypothetical protein FisN_11Lh119 [Fistulifera solaris]|uniref:Uncharacterized protein n=1 Tax=Fistulifera solaris TaxID=1519565 RepID=A0A1Z5J7I3_FISSO|nr:hypothetical protein FisN_11Lh119 [Fistulifera solaris]|eukprot:GAX09896.1 hypothetical protein FisN_11Lh119 [Fistulifera solaris]